MRSLLIQTLTLLAALASGVAFATGATNVSAVGVALQGYDPVAYFVHNQPTKGNPSYALSVDGVIYRFTSLEHMQIFAADPSRYAPQYGGFCAYGVANGAKADIDPAAFSIVEGKLYLNNSASIQRRWRAGEQAHIKAANEKWKTLATK